MNFIRRNGEERITHFDLANALRVESKTIKYHIDRRQEHLKAFGDIEEDATGRLTYYLNKKQALLLMTFVSNNPEAKIYIINSLLENTERKEDLIVEKCKQFIEEVGPSLQMDEIPEADSAGSEEIAEDCDKNSLLNTAKKSPVYEADRWSCPDVDVKMEKNDLEAFMNKVQSTV